MLNSKLMINALMLPRTSTSPAPEPVSGVMLALALGVADAVVASVGEANTTAVDVDGSAGGAVVLSTSAEDSVVDVGSVSELVAVVVASSDVVELASALVVVDVVVLDELELDVVLPPAGCVVFCTRNQFADTGVPSPLAATNPLISKFNRFDKSLLSVKTLVNALGMLKPLG